ncbi:unnamed protein product [Periconia digitata]|uniref:Uncharacterized protein n=1 Tax=Periconia digitata TaxID=1303443 RepID=A0A9W4XMQ2_9PLEO|nr:unnamed protein product [Periconia digitata]
MTMNICEQIFEETSIPFYVFDSSMHLLRVNNCFWGFAVCTYALTSLFAVQS